jgi:hypothetical protein
MGSRGDGELSVNMALSVGRSTIAKLSDNGDRIFLKRELLKLLSISYSVPTAETPVAVEQCIHDAHLKSNAPRVNIQTSYAVIIWPSHILPMIPQQKILA